MAGGAAAPPDGPRRQRHAAEQEVSELLPAHHPSLRTPVEPSAADDHFLVQFWQILNGGDVEGPPPSALREKGGAPGGDGDLGKVEVRAHWDRP